MSSLLPPGTISKTIKHPSGLPAPGRYLADITQSENNARSLMPPPSAIPAKHKAQNDIYPPPKRQTLAERAGQVHSSSIAAPPSGYSVNGSVRAVTTTGIRKTTTTTAAASSSRLQNGYGTRPMGGASSANGLARSNSTGIARPRSSLSTTRTVSSNSTTASRPASALDRPAIPETVQETDNRKGNDPISISAYHQLPRYDKNSVKIPIPKNRVRDDGKRQSDLLSRPNGATRSHSSPAQPYRQQQQPKPLVQSMYKAPKQDSLRDCTLSNAFEKMSLVASADASQDSGSESKALIRRVSNLKEKLQSPAPMRGRPKTPSQIPQRMPNKSAPPTAPPTPSPTPFTPRNSQLVKTPHSRSCFRSRPPSPDWQEAWEPKGKLEDMESFYMQLKAQMDGTTFERNAMKEIVELQKSRIAEYELIRKNQDKRVEKLEDETKEAKATLSTVKIELEEATRKGVIKAEDLERKYRNAAEDVEKKHQREFEDLQRDSEKRAEHLKSQHQRELDRLAKEHSDAIAKLERDSRVELDKKDREYQDLQAKFAKFKDSLGDEVATKEAEIDEIRKALAEVKETLAELRDEKRALQVSLDEANDVIRQMKNQNEDLQSQVEASKAEGNEFTKQYQQVVEERRAGLDRERKLERDIQEVDDQRRKIHAELQDLKGNIRVFCRIRKRLPKEEDEEEASFKRPDAMAEKRQLILRETQKTADGRERPHDKSFTFDRVFGPSADNMEVFGEISELVRSALDGYNVSIFAYGQTGSGKTYTMSDNADSMIPMTAQMIYKESKKMKEFNWAWTIQGSIIEIYNEEIRDLLYEGKEKKQHDVREEGGRLIITDLTEVLLTSEADVASRLDQAHKARKTASTDMNAHSSRSHQVVLLTLRGENSATQEVRQSKLCLVDLAGSENVQIHDNAKDKASLKTEGTNINQSLTSLKRVVASMKEGKVPSYRDSKLTRALQDSLSGNSKMLMFVMVNPLKEHQKQTQNSLTFAELANATSTGKAKINATVATKPDAAKAGIKAPVKKIGR